MKGDEAIARLLAGVELRSAPFIVTIYGDVVVPRGGVLWTGTLIDICARVGINESLVRTAVSRLVAAGSLRVREPVGGAIIVWTHRLRPSSAMLRGCSIRPKSLHAGGRFCMPPISPRQRRSGSGWVIWAGRSISGPTGISRRRLAR